MRPAVAEQDAEAFLRREFRSRLSLVQQLRLYFDPSALFKDVTRGGERALRYNCAMRWVLLPYLRRWLLIALSLFLGIAPADALAAELTAVPLAACGVGFAVAIAVLVFLGAAYLMLAAEA
jgi:hypothetical protein